MSSRVAHIALAFLMAVLIGSTMGTQSSNAQAVQRLVNFQQPSRAVAMDILPYLDDPKKPRIALFRSLQTDRYITSDTTMVDNATYLWELLLLGLRLPFTYIDERDLGGGIDDDFYVVIMPASEAISERQRRRIRDFVDNGGGLIASGRFGMFDEEGQTADSGIFSELFGADLVAAPKAQPFGFLQSIDGNTPLGNGIDVGYQLNVVAQNPLMLARPTSGKPVGRFIPYSPADAALFDSLTTIVYNEYGEGRTVWMRFNPQDLSRDQAQQEAYQRMMVNAIGHLARTTSIAFAPWPEARPAAFSVAAMAAAGFDPRTYMDGLEGMLDILDTQQIPGSFFLASEEVHAFQDLMVRMKGMGEIGLTAENDFVLKGQPMEVQRDRILTARQQLGVQEIHGVYPPADFYDGNTVRAMEEIQADYLLLTSQPSLVPGVVDWWSQVDYRERLTLEDLQVAEIEEMPLFVPGEENVVSTPMTQEEVKALPDPLSIIPVTEGLAPTFEASYDIVRNAHGYYVLPYYPETYLSRSVQAADFEKTIARAKREGAWIGTTSEVLTWWRRRGQVRPVIVSKGRDEMHLDLINDSETTLSGLVLEVRGREGQYKDMRISGGEGETMYIEEEDVTLVYLPTLQQGGNRVILTWRR